MSTNISGAPALTERLKVPLYEAFFLFRALFTAAPILFGMDKFFDILPSRPYVVERNGAWATGAWGKYLANWLGVLHNPHAQLSVISGADSGG